MFLDFSRIGEALIPLLIIFLIILGVITFVLFLIKKFLLNRVINKIENGAVRIIVGVLYYILGIIVILFLMNSIYFW